MRACIVAGMAVALLGSAGAAEAQEEAGTASWFSGNVAITSDYAFRGITQSLGDPAVQGGIDLKHPSGFYVGTWGSSVNFGEDLAGGARALTELDVYGGFGASLGGLVDVDLSAIYYGYPGAAGGRNYDFVEVGLGASRALGPLEPGLSLRYSPDFFAGSGSALYKGITLGLPVSVVGLSGSLGHQSISDNAVFGTPDYLHWGVGASVDWFGLSLGGQVIGTDLEEEDCFGGTEYCGTRFVVSVSRAL